MNDVLKVKEAAVLLTVSEQTVRKLVKDGTLPSMRIGKRSIRIPREAAEQFMKSRPTTDYGEERR